MMYLGSRLKSSSNMTSHSLPGKEVRYAAVDN
jgi:hypothetical protein